MNLIKRIIRFFRFKCPECNGVLNNDDCHMTRFGTLIDVYTCQDCGEKWI